VKAKRFTLFLTFVILLFVFAAHWRSRSYAANEAYAVDWQTSSWEFETVDAREIARFPSLVLNEESQPHLTYLLWEYSQPPNPLMYAYWTGNEWMQETIFEDAFGGSLALDQSNQPHVVFHHRLQNSLAYAIRDQDTWQIEIVDDVPNSGKLVLDSNDHPHILYFDWQTNEIWYAQKTGVDWVIDLVLTESPGIYGLGFDFVLDSQDQPRFVYNSYYCDGYICEGSVFYGSWNGAQWDINFIGGGIAPDDAGEVSLDIGLTLDSADRPNIAFFDFNDRSGNLMAIFWNGHEYEQIEFDQESSEGGELSMAIDGNDRPHIAFSDGCPIYIYCNGTLKYAWWTGFGWLVEEVDVAGGIGLGISLALDAGQPIIAHKQCDGLMLARGTLQGPVSWLPIILNQQ
jgi:hypothetical protein